MDHCNAFASACGLAWVVEQADVLLALMRAEVSVSLYFGIPAAVQWADNFLFPTEVWERDGMALLRHDMSLESLLFERRRSRFGGHWVIRRTLGSRSLRWTGTG